MPAPEIFHRHQKAVLWAFDHYDDDGQPVVSSTAVEIDVRWEKTRREVVGPQGVPIATDATVAVDQDIAIGSLMWEGSINDIPGTSEVPESDLYQVINFQKVPDIKNRYIRRVVTLMRFNDTLPTSG